jgi:hypothetical protein
MFMKGGLNFGMPKGRGAGGGTTTQYVFKNGNVEYKVFSSFPGGSFGNMSSFFDNDEVNGDDHDHEDNDGDDDHDDIFSQLFSHPGRHRRKNNRDNRRHNHHSNTNRSNSFYSNLNKQANINKENVRRLQLINHQLWAQVFHAIPLILLAILVCLPYLGRLF